MKLFAILSLFLSNTGPHLLVIVGLVLHIDLLMSTDLLLWGYSGVQLSGKIPGQKEILRCKTCFEQQNTCKKMTQSWRTGII